MPHTSALSVVRPDVASLGYGLFIATNATCMWGGLFPFLPPEIRDGGFMFAFYLVISLVSAVAYALAALCSYRRPDAVARLRTRHAVVPYAAGWTLIVAAAYVHTATFGLAVGGGCLLAVGIVAFFLLWQRLFASSEPKEGNLALLKGNLFSGVIYFGLFVLPETLTTYLIPLVFLPLFALALMLRLRGVDVDQPMFQDVPRLHRREYAHVVRGVWKSVFCVGALGFCAGIMRSLAVFATGVGAFVNVFSMLALSLGAAVLLALWRRRGLSFSVVRAYRWLFPFVLTAFLLLPVLGMAYATWMAGLLYAAYSAATMVMAVHCAQLSREDGINPVFIFGIFSGVATLLQCVGFLMGGLLENPASRDVLPPLLTTGFMACYVLAIIYFVEQGAFKAPVSETPGHDGIELVRAGSRSAGAGAEGRLSLGGEGRAGDGRPADDGARGAEGGDGDEGRAGDGGRRPYRDRVSKQVEAVRAHYGLSGREADVLELLVRGYSVPRVAEELVLSENTIRTHAKRIYGKLDVHRKQDLLDLVGSFEAPAGR